MFNSSGFLNYMKTLLDVKSPNSSKSFTLVLSAIVGAFIGLTICFVIIYDVITNGYVKTDLTDAGIFLLCDGGYMAGAGITKAIVDRRERRRRRDYFDDVYGAEENESEDSKEDKEQK